MVLSTQDAHQSALQSQAMLESSETQEATKGHPMKGCFCFIAMRAKQ